MRHAFSVKTDLFPLLKLAIPLSITGLVQSGVWFFETLFLAHLGQETLAAGALVGWLFGTLIVILYGTLSSVNILIAHQYGAGDHKNISLVLRDGLLLSLCMTIPTVVLFWNMSSLLLFFGQKPSVVHLAQLYFHALAWGVIPNFIFCVILEFLTGIGHARVIMVVNIATVLLNILLSYLLIFGKHGMPALGIAGAGWGLSISYWISAIVLLGYIASQKKYQCYVDGVFTRTKPIYLLELVKVGAPMGIMYCVEVAFFFALTIVTGLIGVETLAANQVAMQYLGVLMSIAFSIAQAVTVRMGHELGAKNVSAAENASYVGVMLSGVLMCMIALIYWFVPDALISLDFDVHDAHNASLVSMIKQFFIASALFQIFEAMRITFFGALRGIKDTRFTLLISILCFWGIALPVGYLFANYCHMGGVGYWWAMVMSAVISVTLLWFRFRFKMRRVSQRQNIFIEYR